MFFKSRRERTIFDQFCFREGLKPGTQAGNVLERSEFSRSEVSRFEVSRSEVSRPLQKTALKLQNERLGLRIAIWAYSRGSEHNKNKNHDMSHRSEA